MPLNKMQEEFRKGRNKGTPGYIVNTTDTQATIEQLLAVRLLDQVQDDKKSPAVVWDCVHGCATPALSATGEQISEVAESIIPEQEGNFVPTGDHIRDLPQALINAGNKLTYQSVLFLIVQDNSILEYAPVAQAIHNLRDRFKQNLRCLVILGLDIRVPSFLAQDMVVLDDPLPDMAEIKSIINRLVDESKFKLKLSTIEAAASACLGMTRFAVESGTARELRSVGIDAKAMSLIRQKTIETSTNKALTFQKETWTFDDVGGMRNFTTFAKRLFAGPKPPKTIVLIDEMEKSLAGASGTAQDNTGASQYILQCLLTNMENNKWRGLIAAGGPGTGKTMCAICLGNEFGIPSLVMDLGATKAKELGATEQNMRQLMKVILSISGEDALFMATVNGISLIPGALRRRFKLGTWYWDTPDAEERKRIWEIQLKRYELTEKPTFQHDGWTGSDIRDTCEMAWSLNCSLAEASSYVSLAGFVKKDEINQLRDTAEREGFRSANYPGAFKKQRVATKSREILN